MNKWCGCTNTTSVKIEQDFRVGGEYRIEFLIDDGNKSVITGTFFEIEPNRKVVYSWNNTSDEYPAKDTIVRVEFIDNGETTVILLNHSKFNKPIAVEGHTMGWGAAFEKLEAMFT